MDFDRDFGINQVFVEDQYERWRNTPAAVSPEWQQYFARLHGLPSPTPAPFQSSAWSQPAAPEVGGDGNGHAALALVEPERLRAEELQEKVGELINGYRIRGHLFANLDPLGLLQPPPAGLHPPPAELDLQHLGLWEEDLEKPFAAGDFAAAVGGGELTLREILARLN